MPIQKTPPPTPEEMTEVIRNAWRRKAISQTAVERDLGIHQSQFSKIVNGKFKKPSGHANRLFEYSKKQKNVTRQPPNMVDAETIRLALTERLMRAWDGTEEGARALEAILDGATRLRARRSRKA